MQGDTLERLERRALEKPEYDSYLLGTCHRLWTKPVDEFEVEDLRIMIGQYLGLNHLVPRALDVLESDPLAEGDFYPGELLMNLIRAESAGKLSLEHAVRLRNVVERAISRLADEDDDCKKKLVVYLNEHN